MKTETSRNHYEAPQAEEIVLQMEEFILYVVEGGRGENAGDEYRPGF